MKAINLRPGPMRSDVLPPLRMIQCAKLALKHEVLTKFDQCIEQKIEPLRMIGSTLLFLFKINVKITNGQRIVA